MITPSLLKDVIESLTEKIPLCEELVAQKKCSWDCCRYTNSYILFLPGEIESALELGFSIDQYEILDRNYFGGVKGVPRDRGCCVDPSLDARAYKSLDCRLFPYWFQIENGNLVLTQGLSCPIIQLGMSIEKHRSESARVIKLLAQDSDIVEFLRVGRMVNYEAVDGVIPILKS